jgi:NAD(P)-dependent dehydrogenase (short-subunit alcohol dehydrogenase family)
VSRLDGRVAIVTGAGRGLGRAHALALAAEGAAVLVNDLGSSVDGGAREDDPARAVVEEIRALGGTAAASHHDVASWDGAAALVAQAVDELGGLDVLVNNAGILRDRTLANMTEAEWDAVVAVHLKGHAAPTRFAVAHWRDRAKAGHHVDASIVHTSSASGLVGNVGQANYASAKAAVVGLSRVVSLESGRYGVRSNVVAPAAKTRMGGTNTYLGDDPTGLDPDRVSPLVVWLASPGCPARDQLFQVHGRRIQVLRSPVIAADLVTEDRWNLAELDERLTPALAAPLVLADLLPPGDLA